MKYFILTQDMKVQSFIERRDLKSIEKLNILSSELNMVPLMIEKDKDDEYPDLIEWKEPIVSKNLRMILKKYDENIFFRPLIIQNTKVKKRSDYFISVFEEVDCLSEKSEFHKDGRIKKLVINKNKIGDYEIFTVKGLLEKYIIISLDVAESLLRRDFLGLKLDEVDLGGK